MNLFEILILLFSFVNNIFFAHRTYTLNKIYMYNLTFLNLVFAIFFLNFISLIMWFIGCTFLRFIKNINKNWFYIFYSQFCCCFLCSYDLCSCFLYLCHSSTVVYRRVLVVSLAFSLDVSLFSCFLYIYHA